MVLGTPTTLTPWSYSRAATPRVSSPPITTSASTPSPAMLSLIRSAPADPVAGRVGAQRVGPRRAEDGPAARQDAADRLDVERDGVPLERPAPAVAEPDELEPVLRYPLADHGPDHCVQPGAVPASGEHSDSHGGKTSAPAPAAGCTGAHWWAMSVLAIDAGTTGVTALVILPDGTVAGRGYQEFRQYYPRPGWVEHLPEEIWQAVAGRLCHGYRTGRRRRRGPRRRRRGDLHRPHQPAGDRGDLGPRHAHRAAARDRLAGPQERGAVPAAARRRARTADHRADRAAARSLLHRDQAQLAGRARRRAVVRRAGTGRSPWAPWTPT